MPPSSLFAFTSAPFSISIATIAVLPFSAAIIKAVTPYIENEDFEPKKIEAVSKACTAMCQWVRAMHKYDKVAKEVEPKRQALRAAQEELDVLTQRLNKLRAQLKAVEDKIAELEAKFTEAVAKKEELAQAFPRSREELSEHLTPWQMERYADALLGRWRAGLHAAPIV